MDPGDERIQNRVQGFLKKIKSEDLRNKVANFKKYLASASSRLRFDSFSSIDDNSQGSSSCVNEENVVLYDAPTPSDSGTCILVDGRTTEMEDPLTNGNLSSDLKLLGTPEETVPRNKSPVQQWVDSLPSEEEAVPKIDEVPLPEEPTDSEVEGFTLGAEAAGVVCPRPYPYVQVTNTCGGSDAGSHCSSMESLLESRKPDPEEILLELGFGGAEEPDTFSRIPSRFLQPSTLKGVEIDEFLKHEQLIGHTYNSGFSGYRGLTGPFHKMPSGIVGKIMERLREAEVGKNNSHRVPSSSHHNRLCLKDSVLSPDNRKWLLRQGVSPEPEGRRIILGENSFVLAKDGGIVEGSYRRDESFDKEDIEEKSRKSDKEGDDIEKTEEVEGEKDKIFESDEKLKPHLTSKIPSLDNEQLEMEYKTIALLTNQLKGSDLSIDIINEEDFYKLTSDERKRIERSLIENALYTYQRRLRDLDLRCHLKEILSSQADRVSSILGRPDQEWLNIARQMTTLLRHQETLRQELRLTRNTYGNN